MQPNDQTRFAAAFTGIQEYYGREVSDTVMEMYWRGLAAFDISIVERAFQQHVMTAEAGRFFPKLADLVQWIEGSAGDKAQLAWTKVLFAIGSVGHYETVVFDDPLIHAVVSDMGGWISMCELLVDDQPFKAKEFESRYRAASNKAERPTFPAKLVGSFEASNRVTGHLDAIPAPVLVGDQEKAKQVLALGSDKPRIAIGTVSEIGQKALAGLGKLSTQ